MATDLERNLISGGIAPTAAKILANALSNLATSRVQTGRQLSDATPAADMREVSSDTRKYVLTNLDYSKDNPFQPGNRTGGKQQPKDHPYRDSQPASSNPTVATPAVKQGKFVTVSAVTTNSVAQSEVTLRVASKGGTHARLNQATGEVESVPLLIEIEPQNKVEATVQERPDATVIKLRFL